MAEKIPFSKPCQMIPGGSNRYMNGAYAAVNPTWHEEDSPWKAEAIFGLIEKYHLHPGSIYEVGCGAGGVLKELSKKNLQTKIFKGYDISPRAIAIAKSKETFNLQFYNQDFVSTVEEHAGLLLVIDVLEHVDDFYTFLRELKNRSTHFIFHIPLDLCCRSLLKPHVLLQQREAVGHIHYFSREMVTWILKDTGYHIIDWLYTKPVVDVKKPDSMKRRLKKIARNISFSLNRDLSATLWGGYSMMILAK